jgi:hypothetical protein
MATFSNNQQPKSSTNPCICHTCDYTSCKDIPKCQQILTAFYTEATASNENQPTKYSTKYACSVCDYYTSKKSNFDEHILTQKHKSSQIQPNPAKIQPQKSVIIYECEICGKNYKDRTGLWRHKKKCNNDQIQLVKYLMQENNELKQMMIETMKKDNIVTTNTNNSNNSTNNNNNVNSHNKTFNLQFFLNETCKDAMNITDFVDSIKLQLTDLENVGRLGYVNGISKIIIKNLNALDETKRPIHCTDTKREILYVKDEDVWKKDNDNDKKCVKKAIKRVAYKNCKLISEFREKHPDCNKSDSRYSDQYNKMIVEAMGGSGDNDGEKEDKIIQNISKEVQIKKKEQLII